MRRMLCVAPVLSGLLSGPLCVTAMQPARATPITYSYAAGTTFTLVDGDTATLSGSFTINPPSLSLTSPAVVITGPGPETGTYAPAENDNGEAIVYSRFIAATSDLQLLLIFFATNIDTPGLTGNPLSGVIWNANAGSSEAISASGGAIPPLPVATPEPASLAILGSAVFLLGLGRRSRPQPA